MTANPLDVACPICNAKAGEHCLPNTPGYQHAPRLFAAENAPKPSPKTALPKPLGIVATLDRCIASQPLGLGPLQNCIAAKALTEDLIAKANAVIDRAAVSPKVKLDSPLWLAVAELRAALTAAQGT